LEPIVVTERRLSRRALIGATTLPLGLAAGNVLASGRPAVTLPPELPNPDICRAAFAPVVLEKKTPLKLTWNASAICTVGVPVAHERGFFAGHNLDVEMINFGGSTDQLLEAIATGKADAGVGMALRWLKPLEQGFDVKITTAIHGGCMRLFTTKASGIAGIADFKGKAIGVADLGAPDKNFFSILLHKRGIDPNAEITWRVFPADMLPVALQKGEVAGFSLSDPLGWIARERDGLVEVSNNLEGEYAHRACCVLGVRGSLIRDNRQAAAALTQALLEAQDWVTANPRGAAEIFAPYSKAPVAQLEAMLRGETHGHHPGGHDLRQEIALYTDELKQVNVIRARTDTAKFAERVTADVLG
jgi:NitT/TauT family transport system substrate-binding protein